MREWTALGLLALALAAAGCASLPLREEQLTYALRLQRFCIFVHEDGHPISAVDRTGTLRRKPLAPDEYRRHLDEQILAGLDDTATALAAENRACAAGDARCPRPLRILVFVHGGLNGYRQDFERMKKLMVGGEGHQPEHRSLFSQMSYYPIFINWNAGLGDSIADDVFFIRLGRRIPWLGVVTSPFVLLSRAAASVFGAPIAWTSTIRNHWDGVQGAQAEGDRLDDLLQDGLDSTVWLGTRALTTPLLEAFGTPAWQIMKRRAQLAVANRLADNEHAREGAARTLMKAIRARVTPGDAGPVWVVKGPAGEGATVPVEITLVGHSMGAIVLNRLLAAVHPLPVRQIVYLAPAAGIDEFEGFLLPYLDHHPRTRFSWYSLSRRDEARESSVIVPRGTLLAWIDGLFERGYTVGQMTQGRVTNVMTYYALDLSTDGAADRVLWGGRLRFRELGPEEKAQAPFDLERVRVHVAQRHIDPGAPRRHGDFDEPRFLGEVLCDVDREAFKDPRFCDGGVSRLPPSRPQPVP